MPARGTHGLRKYGRKRTMTGTSGRSAIAFSNRRLPMKHHGQTTSDTMSIGNAEVMTRPLSRVLADYARYYSAATWELAPIRATKVLRLSLGLSAARVIIGLMAWRPRSEETMVRIRTLAIRRAI